MKHAEILFAVLATLLPLSRVSAATDEDFYGQSPPVYPSREYLWIKRSLMLQADLCDSELRSPGERNRYLGISLHLCPGFGQSNDLGRESEHYTGLF